jgi:hypothetical protein
MPSLTAEAAQRQAAPIRERSSHKLSRYGQDRQSKNMDMDKPNGGRALALILLTMVAMIAVIAGLAIWASG